MSSLNDVYPHKTNSYVGGWKSWKKPSAYVGGSWKDGKKAWVFQNGAWVHVWSSVAAGTFPKAPVANVSNEGVDSDVKVTWDDVPQATSYHVYNVDGTAVTGAGGTTATVFTDTNPQDGKAGYKVKANLPGDYGSTESTSNELTLAQAPSSLTGSQSGQKVTLSWSNANVGSHDQIQVVRGGASLAYLSRGATSYTDDPAPPGASSAYKVRAVISGNHGPYSNTVNVCSTPNVPTSVTLAATTTIGQLKLSWADPSGSYDGYETQYKDDDGTWKANNDGTSPAYHTWSNPASGSRSMRVRTLSACGGSAWVTKSATPGWDTTPPSHPLITSYKPETSWGRMVLRFGVTDLSTAAYRVWRQDPDMGTIGTPGSWVNAGTGNHTVVVGAPSDGKPHAYNGVWLQVKDSWGNESNRTGCFADYDLVASPTVIEPVGSTHWTQNYYGANTTHPNRPFSGISGAGDVHYGYFFYNNRIRNAVTATATHGNRSVTGMKFLSWRVDNACGPNTWVPVSVGTHSLKVDPRPNWPSPQYAASPSAINSRIAIGNANWGNLQWLPMTGSHIANLTTGGDYGIGLSQPSPHEFYCLYRFDLEAYGTRSGAVEITHLG